MEPASIHSQAPRTGSLENPEVVENVPGHVIPILEREFDDFDTEATRFLRRRARGGRVHQVPPQAGRLRPAPARRADGPREAADGRRHARPARRVRRRDRAATCRCARATSRRARTSRCTTCRCPTPRADPRDSATPACPAREGCGNTMRNVTGDPRAGTLDGRAVRHHPVRRRLRALLRPPPDDARRCRARSRRRSRPPTTTTRSRGSTTWRSLPRVRDGVRGVEIRVGGGTSIMPRLAPTLYEFVELDNGDYLKVTEACCGSSTARTSCASTAPGRGSRC